MSLTCLIQRVYVSLVLQALKEGREPDLSDTVYVSLVLQALKEGREPDLSDTNSLWFSCAAGFEGRP